MPKELTVREQFIKDKYEDWLANQTFEEVDVEALRIKVGKFLEQAMTQSVPEYILQRKYEQLHDVFQPRKVVNLFGETEWVVDSGILKQLQVKNDIWVPEHNDSYLDLEPELLLTNKSTKWNSVYNVLRLMISTGENNNNIGRNLYYIVRDKKTQKYLGNLNVSSDYLDVKCRDADIGWTRDQRNGGRINHTAVGSTIVPTQPLGFNYVGGKLLTLLLCSQQVQDDWKRLYGDVLAGITTTSLYGSYSQYTGLKYWKTMGKSMGSSTARPNPELYAEIRNYVKNLDSYKYWEWFHGFDETGTKIKRDHINRCMSFAYRQLGYKAKDYITGHQRGIYFCHLYTNTNEFLREDIAEDKLIPKFDNSTEALVKLWKEKYASKRIRSLVAQDRVSKDVLFYDDALTTDWPEFEAKYSPQVGR